MTDNPSPSGRPEASSDTTLALVWTLFRPALIAIGAIAIAIGGLVLSHRPDHHVASSSAAPTAAQSARAAATPFMLPEPAPQITENDFQGFRLKPPDPSTESEPAASDRYELTLRLEKDDTIEKLLADIEIPEADRKAIDEKLRLLLKKRRLAEGEAITLNLQTLPEQPDAPRLLSLSVRPQPEHEYVITRNDDGSYGGEEKIYKVSPRIVRVTGERNGSLQQSGVANGAPPAAMVEFVRALSYDVDFQRELKQGTRFTVLLEQLVTSDGKVTHPGRLLAGELNLLKRNVTIIRYRPLGGADGFFSPQGESVVRSFLRTPMDASHITSGFGWREHPILGYSAMHTGVDFGAPMGTPILAAGNGKVAMAGFNGGYGLYVKLQHTSDIGTGYGHMSRLGPGIKPGATVRQGQVIGFVGATGMATGPHLHYEFYRGGHPVNPMSQKFAMRSALAAKDLAQFRGLAQRYLAQLKNAPQVTDVSAAAANKPAEPAAAPPPQVAAGR